MVNLAAFCLNLYFVFHRYRGYCPQIKYRVGKTYGTDTHELARVSIFLFNFLAVDINFKKIPETVVCLLCLLHILKCTSG